MANPVLTTSRYEEPGVYIGEVVNPESANLSADARIPAIIAKGSRLALAKNVSILRSFVAGVQLTFSASTPFIAPLAQVAKGDQAKPNRIFKADGTELRPDEWSFIKVPANTGPFAQVQIRDESYDPLATYYIDYQSTDRSIQDQIPISELRQMRLCGLGIDQNQFREYRDYFIPVVPTDVDSLDMNGSNNNVHSAGWVDLTPVFSGTGTGNFAISGAYSHPYSRNYRLVCTAAGGVTPNRTAEFTWQSTPANGGDGCLPPIPLNPADTFPTISITESALSTSLDFGINLVFGFGSGNFVLGDAFTFGAHGPSLVEIDTRYSNSQQYPFVANAVVTAGTPGGLHLQIDPRTLYTGTRNNHYRVKLLSMSGVAPNRIMNFCWVRYGDIIPNPTGTFTVTESSIPSLTPTLTDGVKLAFVVGTLSASVGTEWDILATAPRIYFTAKDSRHYNLNVSSAVLVGSTVTISGGFDTDTTEGRFGTFSGSFDKSDGNPDGYVLLPDNMSLVFRNPESFEALDFFEFGMIVRPFINWNLVADTAEKREVTDFKTDMNSSITGTAGQKYVILTYVPTDWDSIRVQNYSTGDNISFNWITGTQYISFPVNPNVAVKISYHYRGAEPDPGQLYYFTCTFLRPDSYYNVPFLVLRLEDGRNFASPSELTNDLYVGNEVLWDNSGVGAYLVQPKNVDGSGNYTRNDFVPAIRSMRSYPRISDLCLLNFPAALDEVLNENLIANDPFERRPNLVWFGAAIGTPIGDEQTPGSLVYYSRNTLSVRGDSASHGTRILVAPTRATKTVLLDTGVSASVTLDGSFVALAGAARVASFADPATDILRTKINGFDTIQTYTKPEVSLLGQAQILYVNGSPGSYTWGEDTTVDPTKSFERIQLMTQRQFVTKVMIREVDSIVGITPASGAAGKVLIRGKVASILLGLLARGLIGAYQDANGNERKFDTNADIIVYQDQNDLSLYYFNYAWFSRNVIKKLFGLYALNSNDFSTGVVLK